MKKSKKLISWIATSVSALIMLQTLYFKFTAAPESVYIFNTLGLEPYGRIGIGIAELIASILLIIPSSRFYGALLGLGLMLGAIFAHITKLGIEVEKDGGYLFVLSLIVSFGCGICLYLHKEQLSAILNFFRIKKTN